MMLDGDTPFREVRCGECRTQFLMLFYRGDRLTYSHLAPVITPGTGHTAPITATETIPADDNFPQWTSQYAGMTRELLDPRGAWVGGFDVEDDIQGDPRIEVTCRCGPHFVDLAAIAQQARNWRRNSMHWQVG